MNKRRLSALITMLFMFSALTARVEAALIAVDITVTPHSTAGFTAPIVTFSNLSDPGYQISNVHILGGYIDFIYGPLLSPPITAPLGGSYTAINGTQVANYDVNDGCNAVDFNLGGFDSGETFSFLIDPEPSSCGSAVYDFRQRLYPASSVFGYVSFIGPDITGAIELSGNNWVMELIDSNLPQSEFNELYRLSLSQQLPSVDTPEPASLLLLGLGLVGLGFSRRKQHS